MDHSWGYGTDQRLREENQDCHGVFEFPDYTLAVVCDGMGGHVGGAQASTLAVRTIHDAMRELQGRPVAQALEEAIQRTNLVIYESARKNHRLMGMGTTVVAAAITADTVYLAHVGDSRAYLVRKGQVQQLTRDHTMVNLFVDAELLSPEDAATHPEAHVLSRSLGVERQVDVELSDAIPLEPGDVVFLCSDGVHGVVTDWELANVDWRAPHEAVGAVLKIVGTREGDDNATSVAVMMGTSFEDVAPTPVPEPKRFDDAMASAGSAHTAVPLDDDLSDPRAPSDSGAGGYVVYEEEAADPKTEPKTEGASDAQATPAPLQPPPSAQAQPPQAAQPQPPPPNLKKPARRRAPVLPLLVASGALLAAGFVLVLLLLPDSGDAMSDPLEGSPGAAVIHDPSAVAAPEPDPRSTEARDPNPTQADPPAPEPEVPPAPEPAPGGSCPPDLPVFDPELPAAPRRLPHRPSSCTQPPPGGAEQFRAVDAARRRECAVSLENVQVGMVKSIDHCRLYSTAWLCFNEAHTRPMENVVAKDFHDLQFQLWHLEGTPEAKNLAVGRDPTLEKRPAWYRPAVDGLEYRLEAWNRDGRFADYIADLRGEPNVADDIARDVHLEALAAAGLACVPPSERTPAMEMAWARRVYVVASALRGRAGRLLNQHRSSLVPTLRELLDKSVADYVGPDGKVVPVPAVVREAYDVGAGNKEVPDVERPRPVVQKPPPEVEIPDDPGIEVIGPR